MDDSLLLGAASASEGGEIIDVTAETFQAEVLDRSQSQVVMVDFWADWCGPCQSLTPILEKLTGEFAGAVVLAKVNADQEQALAGHFGIRSLPTVLIVHQGQIVDHFMGAQPESTIREMLSRHSGQAPGGAPETPPIEPSVTLDVEALQQAVAAEPENHQLKMQLAVALAQAGQAEAAKEQFDLLPEAERESDQGIAAEGQLELWSSLTSDHSAEQLASLLEQDPGNLGALHDLGVLGVLRGDHEAGFELLLAALAKDKEFEDQLPRKSLISAFKVVADRKVVAAARRKMSSVLF